MEANELQTITEEERIVREDLKEIVKYFRERGMMPSRENKMIRYFLFVKFCRLVIW